MRFVLHQGISSVGSRDDLKAVLFQAYFPDFLQYGVILHAQNAEERVILAHLNRSSNRPLPASKDKCLIPALSWVAALWRMRQFSDAFSEVVKQLREARKLSKAGLAKKAGLHQTYIGLLERGERSPNLDTAKAIADALEMSLGKMITKAETRQ